MTPHSQAVDNLTMFSLHGQHNRSFAYDATFSEHDKSLNIYQECVAPLVKRCFAGYRATIIAYGQTVRHGYDVCVVCAQLLQLVSTRECAYNQGWP